MRCGRRPHGNRRLAQAGREVPCGAEVAPPCCFSRQRGRSSLDVGGDRGAARQCAFNITCTRGYIRRNSRMSLKKHALRTFIYLVAALALLVSAAPRGLGAAPAPQGGSRLFPETNQTVSGRFLEVWSQNGDYATNLYINGFPLTDKHPEDQLRRRQGLPDPVVRAGALRRTPRELQALRCAARPPRRLHRRGSQR